MKLYCELCGEVFDSTSVELNVYGQEVNINCPNGCNIFSIKLTELPDITEV